VTWEKIFKFLEIWIALLRRLVAVFLLEKAPHDFPMFEENTIQFKLPVHKIAAKSSRLALTRLRHPWYDSFARKMRIVLDNWQMPFFKAQFLKRFHIGII